MATDTKTQQTNQIQIILSAAFVGAGIASLIDMMLIWIQTHHLYSFSILVWSTLSAFIFSFLGLSVLSLVFFLLLKISRPLKPLKHTGEIINSVSLLWSTDRNNHLLRAQKLNALWFNKAKLLSIGMIFGSIVFLSIRGFHDPLRISTLTAAVGSPAALLVLFLLNITFIKKRWIDFEKLTPGAVIYWSKISLGIYTGLIGLLLILAAVYHKEIFGVVQISWFYVVLAFLSSCVYAVFKLVPKIKWRVSFPLFLGHCFMLLIAGLVILHLFAPSRQVLRTYGAVSGLVFKSLQQVLDMDHDGFAWLIGGDCHPFDTQSSPFAAEIPHNYYDENCDGMDVIVTGNLLTDPLTLLPPTPKHLKRPKGNILFLMLDASAATHLSLYNYKRNTTPNITQFSKKALVLNNFFAVSNHTSSSMPALLSGQYPSNFPINKNNVFGAKRISGKNYQRLIQQRLKKQGYQTTMIAGHKMKGFIRGFDTIKQPKKGRFSASVLTQTVMAHLKKMGPSPQKPSFVFAHYMDPHHPYKAERRPLQYGTEAEARYDSEISQMDRQLAPILKKMTTPAYKDWLVIITADHGEAFGEHGRHYHGQTLYNEEIKVPLVMRVPESKGRRSKMAGSHLDILPTIFDWADLKLKHKPHGHSLMPLLNRETNIDPKPIQRRIVFSEFFKAGEHFGAFDGRFSLIYHADENLYELYDSKTDPNQKNNLFYHSSHNHLVAPLKKHILDSKLRIKNAQKGKH